jgi:hypothetical protein
MGAGFFKLSPEDLEAGEGVRFELHGVDSEEFGVVIHESDEVLIAFA